MKIVKNIISVTAVAMILLSVTSCGSEDSSSQADSSSQSTSSSEAETVSSAAPSSSSEESAAESTVSEDDTSKPAEEDVFAPMTSPAQELTCLKAEGYGDEPVFSIDNKIAVICSSPDVSSSISVVDPVTDKLIRSFTPAANSELLIGLRPDGTVITTDIPNQKIRFYESGSDTPRVLDYPNGLTALKYAPSADTLYAFSRNISSVDMQTGEVKELVPLDEMTKEIKEVDFGRGIYMADRRSAELNGSLKTELFSLDKAECCSSLPIYNSESVYLTKSYAINEISEDASDDSDLIYSCFNADDGSSVCSFVLPPEAGDLFMSCYSDHILTTVSNTDGDSGETCIMVIDPASGEIGEIHFENDNLITFMGLSLCASPSGRWFLPVSRSDADDKVFTSLIMLDPSQAENKKPLDKTTLPDSGGKEHHELESYFSEQRAKADKIGEKYGIKIVLGEEVLDVPDYEESFQLVPMTSESYNHSDVDSTLDILDKVFSSFPDGFFKKFITPAGGGLRIAIVDDIITEDEMLGEEFTAAGFVLDSGAWITIVCEDVNLHPDPYFVFNHELWHAVQYLVERKYPLDSKKWNSFNPEGFVYAHNYESHGSEDTDYMNTLYDFNKTGEAYFVDTYSRVAPDEDRATLIEQLMREDELEPEYRVSSSSILQAKAKFLADWIKPYFGYVYFENWHPAA